MGSQAFFEPQQRGSNQPGLVSETRTHPTHTLGRVRQTLFLERLTRRRNQESAGRRQPPTDNHEVRCADIRERRVRYVFSFLQYKLADDYR